MKRVKISEDEYVELYYSGDIPMILWIKRGKEIARLRATKLEETLLGLMAGQI